MHSHHSHSGDYVEHASGTLEQMVATAKEKGFVQYCLTEHMPRLQDKYLYPEEIDKGMTIDSLNERFEKYLKHAKEIQERENAGNTIKIIIGLEVEGIDEAHIKMVERYRPHVNMCVGSVHFVKGIPIDFDEQNWRKAREACGGSTRELYKEYYELQYKVLKMLKPEVVGHFDLIRLFRVNDLDETTGKMLSDVNIQNEWPDVWQLIERNVKFAISYGALFELNSAALRKGWDSPYPKSDICLLIKNLAGKFCLSDDSHKYEQIGLNYHKAWEYLKSTIKSDFVYHLDLDIQRKIVVQESDVNVLSKSPFWDQYKILQLN
ncbi:hypothetical_protein [Candidozyma auris]|nr:histidinol-phosphatase [[Candida] auris]QEO21931.1 hypothetical_protein [[Candida] auris]GBL51657.1 putative histidinol phosphate phosphatase [[Candida] auris]